MKKNQVQFQPGMSLMVFLERYGGEAQCREALAQVRWPNGFRCRGCDHTGHCHLKQRDVYQCNRCKRQVSLTSGTLFAETKMPLRTWFLAIYLLTQHKNGTTALALRRQLGVSYNTGVASQAQADAGHDRARQPGRSPVRRRRAVQPGGSPHRYADGCRARLPQDGAGRVGEAPPGARTAVASDGLDCFPGVAEADCTCPPRHRRQAAQRRASYLLMGQHDAG